MADDTTDVVVTDAQPGFEPEPVPDSLADVELTGLQPSDDSTESEQAEDEQAEPTQDDAETDSTSAEDEQDNSETKEAEPQQQPDPKEQARQMYQQRQAQRSNYVDEQRQQIRQYQEQTDMSDVEERMRVLEAQQFVDTIERNRQTAITDYTRATTEIPFFSQNTPQTQAALTTAIQQFNDAYAVIDPDTGEYLGAQDRNGNSISLFNYLATEAARFETVIGTTQAEAQRTAQKAEARMRSKVVNPSNPGKVTSSGDELDDLLDKIGDVPLN